MLDSDKKMLVNHVVEQVFIPELMVLIKGAILTAKQQAVFQHEYKKATSYDINLPPFVIDFRAAQDKLAQAIVIVTKDYPPTNG